MLLGRRAHQMSQGISQRQMGRQQFHILAKVRDRKVQFHIEGSTVQRDDLEPATPSSKSL